MRKDFYHRPEAEAAKKRTAGTENLFRIGDSPVSACSTNVNKRPSSCGPFFPVPSNQLSAEDGVPTEPPAFLDVLDLPSLPLRSRCLRNRYMTAKCSFACVYLYRNHGIEGM